MLRVIVIRYRRNVFDLAHAGRRPRGVEQFFDQRRFARPQMSHQRYIANKLSAVLFHTTPLGYKANHGQALQVPTHPNIVGAAPILVQAACSNSQVTIISESKSIFYSIWGAFRAAYQAQVAE